MAIKKRSWGGVTSRDNGAGEAEVKTQRHTHTLHSEVDDAGADTFWETIDVQNTTILIFIILRLAMIVIMAAAAATITASPSLLLRLLLPCLLFLHSLQQRIVGMMRNILGRRRVARREGW